MTTCGLSFIQAMTSCSPPPLPSSGVLDLDDEMEDVDGEGDALMGDNQRRRATEAAKKVKEEAAKMEREGLARDFGLHKQPEAPQTDLSWRDMVGFTAGYVAERIPTEMPTEPLKQLELRHKLAGDLCDMSAYIVENYLPDLKQGMMYIRSQFF